jgi:hypothetical protein
VVLLSLLSVLISHYISFFLYRKHNSFPLSLTSLFLAQANEFDALRAVLFALEATAAMSTLKEKIKIGISGGRCLSCPIGNDMRRDWTIMGTEVNMAARLCGKALVGTCFCSEKIYDLTKSHVSFDMSSPLLLKGRDGEQRALSPVAKKVGLVRRKVDEMVTQIFCGRKKEMATLREAVEQLRNNSKGGAFILEGLAGIGKSAIVQQLQRDAEEMGIRFLLGSGFAIEKETPFYAFSQLLCSAAGLSYVFSYILVFFCFEF